MIRDLDQSIIESMKPRQLGAAIRAQREAAFTAIKGPEFSKAQDALSLLGVLHRAFTTRTGRNYPIDPPTGRAGR